MKKSLKTLLAIGILFSITNIHAELVKVFGLKDQNFAEVTSTKVNKYQISENLIATIKLNKDEKNEAYKYINKSDSNEGLFELTWFDDYPSQWIFNEDVILAGDDKADRVLKFVDINGLAVSMKIDNKDYRLDRVVISIDNDVKYKQKGDNHRLSFEVMGKPNTLHIKIGESAFTIHKKGFSKLKYIQQGFFDYNNNEYGQDVLVDMTVTVNK